MQRVLWDMLCLLALTALLWAFHLYARTLPTPALAVLWIVMTLIIAAALFWRSRIRRRAFISAYIAPASVLSRWLRGGWFLAFRQLALAAVLGLVLAVTLVRLPDVRFWILLIATVPVLVLAECLTRRMLAAHVSAAYLPELSWRLTLLIVGGLMLVALVAVALHRAYPDVSGVGLERAVWHLVDQEQARSDGALLLLQMAAAKDGLRLWLAQQLMPQPGVSLTQFLGWVLIVAEESLFVWSYLLICNGVLIGVNARDRTGG